MYDVVSPLPESAVEPLMPAWNRGLEDAAEWSRSLARIHSTKIGGLLSFEWENRMSLDTPVLFSMTSLYPRSHLPYSFVNRPDPLSETERVTEVFPRGAIAFSLAVTCSNLSRPDIHFFATY
jgi:hypothetical protein